MQTNGEEEEHVKNVRYIRGNKVESSFMAPMFSTKTNQSVLHFTPGRLVHAKLTLGNVKLRCECYEKTGITPSI